MNFAPTATEVLSDLINDRINAALAAKTAAEPKRTYLGASRIGAECERRLAFEYHGHAGEPFPGRAIRRFRMGHLHEDETAAWLRKAGFDLRTHKPDGNQFGFGLAPHPETGANRFAGHADGIIIDGPALGAAYPGLWEHKIMKSKIWTKTQKGGVKKEHYLYYAQTQIYMRQFGLKWCLFTALNTDTSDLYCELIHFNEAEADALITKAARIIESRSPEELPRAAANEMDYRCKWCPFRVECWQCGQRGVETAARPAWLGGGKVA